MRALMRSPDWIVSSILALFDDKEERATHVGVAFDNPIRSFRNDLFDGYKTDGGIPEDLYSQFDPVEEAVRAIGVTVWSMNRWEADDALANERITSAYRHRREGLRNGALEPGEYLRERVPESCHG